MLIIFSERKDVGGSNNAALELYENSELIDSNEVIFLDDYIDFSGNKLKFILSLPLAFFGVLKKLKKLNKACHDQRKKTIICNHFLPSIFGFLYSIIFGNDIKFVSWVHTNLKHYLCDSTGSRHLYAKLVVACIRKFEVIVCVSNEQKIILDQLFDKETTFIPNLTRKIDLKDFKKTSLCSEIRFLFVGRLVTLKNVDLIIKAFSSFLKENSADSCLDIVGDGPELENLVNLVQSLGMEDRILFHGHKDPIEFYGKSSALVMASDYEGFPLTFLESSKFALPVICTDFSTGAREYLNGGSYFQGAINGLLICQNGILIEQSSEESGVDHLSLALAAFCDNESLRLLLSDNVTKNAGKYSSEAIISKWRKIHYQP
ncbi:glycosyltransferase [Vibrio superstes]|uniref:Glycosyl transferase family 1 domain-containing protein n=1 Tax=Vibrio superstes NBRC 103154 TaxID=1219062 RepID=A0A511QTY2_9VIBR|nr:glycosyltransferase [Vibrio superstes]GEM80814.1 hypothetical protein VSU01S_30590 [Vibrio superstes NBRC 103154]